MRYIEHETLDGKKHRKLTPAVHNLLFIEKEFTEKELLERVKDCTIPFLLVRDRSTRRCYEIPDCEMLEFRAVCDPNYLCRYSNSRSPSRTSSSGDPWPVCRT